MPMMAATDTCNLQGKMLRVLQSRQCIFGLFCGFLLDARNGKGQSGSQTQEEPLIRARVEQTDENMEAVEPDWCL